MTEDEPQYDSKEILSLFSVFFETCDSYKEDCYKRTVNLSNDFLEGEQPPLKIS